MKCCFGNWCTAVVLGLPLLICGSAGAQDLFEIFNVSEGQWTNDDNWADPMGDITGQPSISFDTGGQISNGGTAIVEAEAEAAGINVSNGTIDIREGGSLMVDTGGINVADSVIGTGGELRLSGNGSFETALGFTNRGTLDVGPNAGFQVAGDADVTGNILVAFTDSGNSTINVGGDAKLGGTISPTFTNVTPSFGDSFKFLEAGSVALGNASVQLPAGVSLPRGLESRVVADNTSASITFDNLPILQVDRASGAATITNVVGGPLTMTGYAIESASGLLSPEGFTGFGGEGWDRPNPIDTSLAEISLTEDRAVAVDETISVGSAYNGGATHPNDEDVVFKFVDPSGAVREGLVEYTGPANDLVLNLNPETGEATIQNLSQFIDPIEVTGYSILSASGSLLNENWTSFASTGAAGEGWTEANPGPEMLSELNLSNSQIFDNGTAISLGNIFDVEGPRDIVMQYTTTDAFLTATVEYQVPGDGPMPGLPGDIDGDGTVGFPDFLILSANFGMAGGAADGDIDGDGNVGFPDFLILSGNFGQSASVAAAAVPEPGSLLMLALGAPLLALRRRRSA